ncbi:partner of xrn-2 protein 1-like [Amphibalanus amphitrite]|uniref:partner of xrn-2 protein 1-like n=1 Tax=Amphibalanus amphitrite TaxID=1232801 RepID=UPI001C91C207|nr:partner of xrn-2 protein 1-like [Amphibalanus amphitrite]
MSIDSSWDIEQYRNEHEPPEHWELCKNFILAHKKDFPEEKLICLAQVFANMEFLGCRYPQETMDLVNELAAGVVEDFREQRKSKIQRTFIGAASAAEAKVKRSKTLPPPQHIK